MLNPDGAWVAGWTFPDERTIDVEIAALGALVHELRHVALGPSSWDHRGWCPFIGWELDAGLANDMAAYGCQEPR